MVIFNAGDDAVDFCVPRPRRGVKWELAFDTSLTRRRRWQGELFNVAAHSLAILRAPRRGS
jgi:hypothetical protein